MRACIEVSQGSCSSPVEDEFIPTTHQLFVATGALNVVPPKSCLCLQQAVGTSEERGFPGVAAGFSSAPDALGAPGLTTASPVTNATE